MGRGAHDGKQGWKREPMPAPKSAPKQSRNIFPAGRALPASNAGNVSRSKKITVHAAACIGFFLPTRKNQQLRIRKVSLQAFFSKKAEKYAPHGSAWSLNGAPITRAGRAPQAERAHGVGKGIVKACSREEPQRYRTHSVLTGCRLSQCPMRGLCVSIGLECSARSRWRRHAARARRDEGR